MNDIKGVLHQCKKVLQKEYGEQFKGLVLYGSMARGDYDEDSDVDLMLLLDEMPSSYGKELWRVIDVLYDIKSECDRYISTAIVPFNEFSRGSIQLYRNAKKDGIFV